MRDLFRNKRRGRYQKYAIRFETVIGPAGIIPWEDNDEIWWIVSDPTTEDPTTCSSALTYFRSFNAATKYLGKILHDAVNEWINHEVTSYAEVDFYGAP